MACRSLPALLRLLAAGSEPSPCALRVPGYIRALSAEAAPAPAAAAHGAPDHLASPQQDVAYPDPLSAAQAATAPLQQLLATLQSAAAAQPPAAASGDDSGVLPAFESIHQFHQLQQEVEARGIRPRQPHVNPTLASMAYHQRLMDGTREGRLMQKRWQEQIILETRTVEASAMRYKLEMQAAVNRKEAASMPPARRLLMQWFKPLALAIQEEQRK
ncbi:hypothetical protein N2152v2_011225, partial [Parachlorella kessleri]